MSDHTDEIPSWKLRAMQAVTVKPMHASTAEQSLSQAEMNANQARIKLSDAWHTFSKSCGGIEDGLLAKAWTECNPEKVTAAHCLALKTQ